MLQVLGAIMKETSITILSNLVVGKNLHTLIFDPSSTLVIFVIGVDFIVDVFPIHRRWN